MVLLFVMDLCVQSDQRVFGFKPKLAGPSGEEPKWAPPRLIGYALRSSMLKSLRSRSPMIPKAMRFLSMCAIIIRAIS